MLQTWRNLILYNLQRLTAKGNANTKKKQQQQQHKKEIKENAEYQIQNRWQDKSLPGQFSNGTKQSDTDKRHGTHQMSFSAGLNSESVDIILAAD